MTTTIQETINQNDTEETSTVTVYTDTATLTDSLQQTVDAVETIQETASFAESIALLRIANFTESVNFAEDIQLLESRVEQIQENMSVNETVTLNADYQILLNDTITITE